MSKLNPEFKLPEEVMKDLFYTLDSTIDCIDFVKDLSEFKKLPLGIVQRLSLIRSLCDQTKDMLR